MNKLLLLLFLICGQQVFAQLTFDTTAVKAELKALINKEDEDVLTDISLPAIQRGLDSIKKLKEGKVKTTNARQFLAELKEELAQ